MADSIDTSEKHDGRTSPSASAGRSRRWLWWIVGIVVAVLVGLYVAGWFMTGNRVPNGTTVAGIDIGGLRTENARDRLESGLVDDAAASVRFSYDGQTYALEPKPSGLSIDVDETLLDAGGGRSWNPVRMADLLFGSAEAVEPVVTVDVAQLRDAVDDISSRVESDPTEPAVSFSPVGEPQIDEPVVGVDVDEDAAVETAGKAYLTGAEPLDLPVDEVQPSVTAAEVDDARQQLIEPAVSAPVSLQLPGRVVQIPVRTYAPALTMAPVDGELVPAIDVDVLTPRLAAITSQLSVEPQDARVVLRGQSPVVIPDRSGVELEPQKVADAILSVLTESGQARTAEAGTSTARADFTTADARALGIRERVSDFVTYYPYAEYRNINQGRAAELVAGTVLAPGETFSFNETVGERT
ncbi:MAG: peptidoglycan binding domain-containing protein, partial [Actinomycetota bacterium]|nr:peptidoglycan binding domain-containing protein [Actinomycetota bacterium]